MVRRSIVSLGALVALFAFSGSAYAVLPNVPSASFAPAAECGCHAGLLTQWTTSMHAKAITDPLYLYKLGEANDATDGALGPFCNGCHTPVGVMSGEAIGSDLSKVSDVAKEGVTCDFCHQIKGTAGPLGNTSVDITADAIKRAVVDEPGVVSAHTVAGEASALLHVMANDTRDLELVLERIRAVEGIDRTVTEVVLSTLVQR